MDPQEYRIERLDKNKFRDMAALYKAVYGREVGEIFFQNKYDTAYTAIENMGYLAYQGQTPAAYYGVIPCFIEYENKLLPAAQSADTMTHPQHRYKGLFARLAGMTFELCKVSGVRFIFGFPNQDSHHGFSKTLAWEQTETLDSFTIPVTRSFFVSAIRKFALTKPIYNVYAKTALRNYLTNEPGIPNSVIRDGFGGIYRNPRYLKYKLYSDTRVITIGQAKLWIRIKNNLSIGDIANIRGSGDLDIVIGKLKKIAKHLGLSSINFQVSPGTSLHALFAKNYEPSPSFATMFHNLGANLPFEKFKFTLADIDIF